MVYEVEGVRARDITFDYRDKCFEKKNLITLYS